MMLIVKSNYMFKNINMIAIIPARYDSERLPGKLMKHIGDRPIIQHVYENAVDSKLFDQVIIACDQAMYDRINFSCVKYLTSSTHLNGTTRIAEVAQTIDADIVFNIQGDEPFLPHEHLQKLAELMKMGSQIGTLIKDMESDSLFDFNKVKVVTDQDCKALYFSRHAIPAHRDQPFRTWANDYNYQQHIGLYAFQREVLLALQDLSPSQLSTMESLEQLNWMYHGYEIRTVKVAGSIDGVDTEDDLIRAREYYKNELSKE